MFGSKTLKTALIGTTALVGALTLDARTQIMADTTVFAGSARTSTVFLGTGSNLTVQNTGSILPFTAGVAGVHVTGATAGSINNSGVISGNAATGILVETGDGLSGGITNNGQINGTIGIKNVGTISNQGTHGTSCTACNAGNGGGAAAVSVSNNGTISGGITNASTISGQGGDGGVDHGGLGSGGNGGAGGQGVGISLTTSSTISQGITSSGTISGQGGAGGGGYFNGGAGGAGIGLSLNDSSISGGITLNGGTISGLGGAGGGGNGTTPASTGGRGGTGIGIGVTNSGTITGGIINNGGTISGTGGAGGGGLLSNGAAGTGTGILIDASSAVNGGAAFGAIHNTGTISGSTVGINNAGAISQGVGGTTAVSAAGIANLSTGTISSINNSGTVFGGASHTGVAAGTARAAGIFNSGTITGAIVNNSGTISAVALHSGTGTGAAIAGGIFVINNGTIGGGINNLGTITGTAHNTGTGLATGVGIWLKDSSSVSGGINNSGTISGIATGSTPHATGIRIDTNAHLSGGIVNNGTISGAIGIDNKGAISNTATGAAGVSAAAILNLSTINGGINNGGTISAHAAHTGNGAGTALAAGILVNNGTINGGINNAGTISGVASHTGTGTGAADAAGIYLISSGVNGGIVNSGTISGSASNTGTGTAGAIGIFLHNATVNGGIHNSGTISGDIGILIDTGSTVSGSITNSGLIDGIVNNGAISAQGIAGATGGGAGGIAAGIRLFNIGTISGDIANNGGTISAQGGAGGGGLGGGIGGQGAGINVMSSSSISGAITNTGGTISGQGGVGGPGLFLSGGGGAGIGINVTGTFGASVISGAVANTGTISGQGGAGAGAGIGFPGGGGAGFGINVAGSSTSISGAITNTGTISGQGGVGGTGGGTGGAGGQGVGIKVGNSGTIAGIDNNGGTISGTGGAGGTGSAAGAAGAGFGIFVSSASISGAITNSGTISGSMIGIVIDVAQITGGIISQPGGIIEGAAGGTAISLNLTGLTPIELDGGQIIGDVTDISPDAGNSPVTVGGAFVTNGNFTVSDLILPLAGSLTISKGNTFTASQMTGGTGTLTFGVLNATPGTGFGELVVHNGGNTGALNLTGLTVTVDATGATLAKNDQMLVGHGDVTLTGTAGASGQALTTVTDNSALLNFEIADGSDTTDLLVANQTGDQDLYLIVSSGQSLGGLANTIGNRNIGNVLENTVFTDPTLLEIQGNLNGASNADEVNDILSSAGPTVNGSDFAGSVNVSDSTQNFTDDRIASLRTGEDSSTGMAAGDVGHGTGAWGEVFGQHTDQNDRDNIAGFTANTWGAALGLDTRNVSDKAILGLGFSYGRTDANSDNSNSTDTNVNNYEVSLYGNYNFDSATYLTGMAGYTWGNVDTVRHNVGGVTGLTAHGSYDTKQISARAEAGHDYAFHGLTLTPNLVADWVNWDPDSYTETGAGGSDLHVNGRTLNRVDLGAGVKAGWSFKNSDGSWIKPQLRAGYRYAVVDDRIEDVAQFTGGGGAFSVPGPDPARSSVDLGASVKLLTTNNWTFTGSYDFDWKSDYNASAGFVRASYRF